MEKFFPVNNLNTSEYLSQVNSWLRENPFIIPERLCVGEFSRAKNGGKASAQLGLEFSFGSDDSIVYAVSLCEVHSYIKLGLETMLEQWRIMYPQARVALSAFFHGYSKDNLSDEDAECDCNRLWVMYQTEKDLDIEDYVSDVQTSDEPNAQTSDVIIEEVVVPQIEDTAEDIPAMEESDEQVYTAEESMEETDKENRGYEEDSLEVVATTQAEFVSITETEVAPSVEETVSVPFEEALEHKTHERRFCSECGTAVSADSVFCGECGFRLD